MKPNSARLSALTFRAGHASVAEAGLDAWQQTWRENGPIIEEKTRRFDNRSERVRPAAVSALAQVGRNTSRRYYDSSLLYGQAEEATQLPMVMTTERAITVLIATIGMCCFSGLLAIRKLKGLDPAEVF